MIKDLIILTADKDAKFTLEGLINRHHSFGIRSIEFDVTIHPQHDPGVYKQASEFLRPFINQYRYSLVFLDKEGSGQEDKTAPQIRQEIKSKLAINGWEGRSEVIVLEPELEIWLWMDSPDIAWALGWGDYQTLKESLVRKDLWEEENPKPDKPKEAFDNALKALRIPHSSAIFKHIAERVGFEGCIDRSFVLFRNTITEWFREDSGNNG